MAHAMTWNERLDEPAGGDIRPVPEGRKRLRAGQMMLYPNGREVAAAIQTIPQGQSRTVKELQADLALRHGADVVCPVTTAISLRTVAEATFEAFSAGTPIEEITPVWRVLPPKAPTLKRVSFDPDFILEQRRRERL